LHVKRRAASKIYVVKNGVRAGWALDLPLYIFYLGFYKAHLEKVPEGLVSLANAHFTVELALRLIWLPRAVHHALHYITRSLVLVFHLSSTKISNWTSNENLPSYMGIGLTRREREGR
jgi:hypothetical protein